MNKLLSATVLAVATVFILTSLVSCGPTEPPVIQVTSVSVNPVSAILDIGETVILTATVSPSDATDKTVTWTSSNPSVVTVSNGTITTVGEGSATITATAGGKSGTCQVTVKPKPEEAVLVVGNAARVPAAGATVEVDIQYNVNYTVKVETGSGSWIHYVETRAVQSGKMVFTVDTNFSDEEREGKVTITDNGGKAEPVTITIVQESAIKVESVELDRTELELDPEEFILLNATLKPDDATNKNVIWESDNNAVATVDNRGLVTAKAVGTATITAKAGDASAKCTVRVADMEEKIKSVLMKIYDAMDGPNWTITQKWDLSKPLNKWEGVNWNKGTDELTLIFNGQFGLKGEFPDCFEDLTPLNVFLIQNEKGVTGTLPPSFGKLSNLESLTLNFTSMTSLPDIFEDLPLVSVHINGNTLMTGPLPETLGRSQQLEEMNIGGNAFTGTVPDSWAGLGTGLDIEEAFLDGIIPDSFVRSADADYLINMNLISADDRTTPIAVGDYDIPAYWPRRDISDLVTGKAIPFKEIVSKNKVTVLLNWATWCPYSKELLPVLMRMYEKYHDAGLEIIASFNADSPTEDSGKTLKEIILERNYEKWYNFNLWDFSATEWSIWCSGTPSAILVDNKGNILTSSRNNVSDPARNRFGYRASTELIPLLEGFFGPLEEVEEYSSSDYSMNGKVMTLQKAKVGKGINIVFMGDAYTDRDMNVGGLYETLMNQSMEELFKIEPYKTFRDRFNVYAVKVVSKNDKTGVGYSTALGTEATYTSITTGDIDKCYEYALKVPGIKDDKNLLIGVLINSASGRGITSMSDTRQSSVAFYGSSYNECEAFGNTIRHEAGGHGFAFLDDEYITIQGQATNEHINDRDTKYKKYGWYANVDFTNDPTKVKWSAFLKDDRYKDEVGIFEGGSLYSKGAYRPSQNSMMNDNFEYYNAPSRWAIYQRIMKLSGESYSFEKFLQYDAVNRGKK